MPRLLSVCMVMLALLGAICAKSWTVQNDVPTGFNLYRMASGPTSMVAVGDDCIILRSLDQGGKWSQVPSGLSFTNSSFEALNWPGLSFRDLAYDPNAGQFTALVLSFADGYSTTAYTLVYSADSSAASFSPVPGFAYPGMQQVPVYGLGRWVSINFTFTTATPTALVSTNLTAGFTSQPILLNCNCDIASAPAWSASLNAFIILLDREIQTSVDGVNWKTLYQNKYPPLPYLQNDALGYQPPRPVFADPTWLYFTNNSGVIYQVLVSFKSRTPTTTLLPLTVPFYAIAWVRYTSRTFARAVTTQQATILQYSSDAYTWYNYSAAMPQFTTDVIGDSYFPALASGYGGIYRTYINQWRPVGVIGVLGNFLFARWLDGPKAGFFASGSGYLESAAPLAYSPDGIKWSAYNPVSSSIAAAQDIQYLASLGIYVLVYPGSHVVYFSIDGVTYYNYTLPKTQGSHPQPGPVCGPNAPALVVPSSIDSESTALTLVSTDGGRTFQLIATNQPESPLLACAYGNGVYVGIDSAHASVYTSTTGAAWTKTVTLSGLYYYKNVKFVGTNFVAVGDYGYVAFSINGAIWTETTVPNGEAVNGVTYANGLYLAVGEGGSVYSSPDLMTWTRVPVPVYTSLSDGAFSPALNATVIVGTGGTVLLHQ